MDPVGAREIENKNFFALLILLAHLRQRAPKSWPRFEGSFRIAKELAGRGHKQGAAARKVSQVIPSIYLFVR